MSGTFWGNSSGSKAGAGSSSSTNKGKGLTKLEAARQNNLKIREMQEKIMAQLPQRHPFIMLHLRSAPAVPNDFHWGLYYHVHANGGMKYHIKGEGGGWIKDTAWTGGMLKSNFLVVAIQLGPAIPEAQAQLLDRITCSLDDRLNTSPALTCRVWVLDVVQKLVQAGLLRCDDLAALERECFDFGNLHSKSAERAAQPRPIVVSRHCA